jgi:hypothetical protein
VRDITNLKRGEIKIDLVFNRIQPSGGRPRQPSGSDLSFPYGECLNKRKAKQPKCIESPRATGARSGKGNGFPRDKREAFARISCSNKKTERDADQPNRIALQDLISISNLPA